MNPQACTKYGANWSTRLVVIPDFWISYPLKPPWVTRGWFLFSSLPFGDESACVCKIWSRSDHRRRRVYRRKDTHTHRHTHTLLYRYRLLQCMWCAWNIITLYFKHITHTLIIFPSTGTRLVYYIIMSLRAVACSTLRDDCGLHRPKDATVLMTQFLKQNMYDLL